MRILLTSSMSLMLLICAGEVRAGDPYKLASSGNSYKTHLQLYKNACTSSSPNAIFIGGCGSGGGCLIAYKCFISETCCSGGGDPCCTGNPCSGGTFSGACTDTGTPSQHRFSDGHLEIFDSTGTGKFKMEIKMEGIVQSETDTSLLNKSCPSNCWTINATVRRATDSSDPEKSNVAVDNTTTMVLPFGISNGVANTTTVFENFAGNDEIVDVVVKDEAGSIVAIPGRNGIVE